MSSARSIIPYQNYITKITIKSKQFPQACCKNKLSSRNHPTETRREIPQIIDYMSHAAQLWTLASHYS